MAVKSRLKVCADRIRDLENKLKDLSLRIQAKEEEREEISSRQKDLEQKIEDATRLAKKAEKRLMDIKTTREYRALQRELDDSKGSIKEMEDESVQCMEQIEELDAVISVLKKEHDEINRVYQTEREEAEAEMKEKEGWLKKLTSSREKIADQLEPRLFNRYEAILRSLSNQAVVPVEAMVCKGCNMNIPPQTYNELQRGDELKFCPHCERILYYKDTGDNVE
ncbi:MAG: hypothetical protein JRI97_08385 [Deltaproteobacteria bacterium]|nr:hypothetical protein [Deltaproteobacteria bacterium]